MAYSSFKTLAEITSNFGVVHQRKLLFDNVKALAKSEDLTKALVLAQELPVKSEKARCEMIVTPILLDLRQKNNKIFTIFSGDTLNADDTRGLNGECDFILAKDKGSFEVSFPIIQVVEAKRNDVEVGIPQCAAQMIGAQLWNENNQTDFKLIYGCVTTGDDWVFLKLIDNKLFIDTKKYYLGNIEELLGVFQNIIDEFHL